MLELEKIWNWDFMWETFAYLLKISAPFVMVVIAILAVGALIYFIVKAVKGALDK